MSISTKIKALLSLCEKDHAGLAENFGISKQALSNKFYRGSFSAEDLIKAADFCGCTLTFTTPSGDTIKLEPTDIAKED